MKRVALGLLFIFFFSCSSIPEFQEAQRNFSFGNYGIALQKVKIALTKDPDNQYYHVFQKIIQERLSEEYYQESLSLLEKGRFSEAQRVLEKILDKSINPGHLGAARKLSQINEIKGHVKEKLQKAKENMNQGNWDEAYQELSNILVYEDEFTPIQSLYQKSKIGSFQMHFKQGQNAFHQKDYTLAKEEFQTALSRIPTSEECLEWQNKSILYQNALSYTKEAQKLFEEKQYFLSMEKYNEALKLVSSFPEAQNPRQNAIRLWAEEMLEKSQKYMAEAGKSKSSAFKAMNLLEKIQKYSPGHKPGDSLLVKAKTACAEHLFQEARNFLWQKDFSQTGIAYFYLQLASELDRTLPGLEPMLIQCKRLVAFQFHRHFLFVPREGESLKQILQEIVQNLERHTFPYYSFSTQSAEKIQEKIKRETSGLLHETGIATIPARFYHIHLHLEKWEIQKKEEKEKMLFSEYFSGLKEEADPFWETYKSSLETARESIQKLFPVYSKALEEYENNFVELQKREQEKKASERALQQYQNFKNRIADWKNALQSARLSTWELAREFEQSLETQLRRIAQETEEAKETHRKSHALSEMLWKKMQSLEKQILSLEEDMEKYQKYIDFHPKKRKVEQRVSYNFYQSHIAWEAMGKIFLSIVQDTGKTAGDFSHTTSLMFDSTRRENIHPWDTRDYYSIKAFFPQEDTLKKEKSQMLAHGIYSKLLVFLKEYPLSLWKQGTEGKSIECMEKLAEFLELSKESYPEEYQEARKILKDFAGWSIN